MDRIIDIAVALPSIPRIAKRPRRVENPISEISSGKNGSENRGRRRGGGRRFSDNFPQPAILRACARAEFLFLVPSLLYRAESGRENNALSPLVLLLFFLLRRPPRLSFGVMSYAGYAFCPAAFSASLTSLRLAARTHNVRFETTRPRRGINTILRRCFIQVSSLVSRNVNGRVAGGRERLLEASRSSKNIHPTLVLNKFRSRENDVKNKTTRKGSKVLLVPLCES